MYSLYKNLLCAVSNRGLVPFAMPRHIIILVSICLMLSSKSVFYDSKCYINVHLIEVYLSFLEIIFKYNNVIVII